MNHLLNRLLYHLLINDSRLLNNLLRHLHHLSVLHWFHHDLLEGLSNLGHRLSYRLLDYLRLDHRLLNDLRLNYRLNSLLNIRDLLNHRLLNLDGRNLWNLNLLRST